MILPDIITYAEACIISAVAGWYFGYLHGVYDNPARCLRIFCRDRLDGELTEEENEKDYLAWKADQR